MKRWLLGGVVLALWAGAQQNAPSSVEVIRDRWGIPHIYAEREADAFFGAGYAAAEDRLLQMDLLRRRARGRLSEVFGRDTLASDRKFRVAQVGRYCTEAATDLPDETKAYLRAYAAGVNAYMARNPDRVARRFARLGAMPAPWTDGDCICAWMGVAEVFDRLYDEGAVTSYREFQQLAATLGEEEALKQRGMILDDAAAVVPESEMAKDAAVYARLKAMAPMCRRNPSELGRGPEPVHRAPLQPRRPLPLQRADQPGPFGGRRVAQELPCAGGVQNQEGRPQRGKVDWAG